MKQLSPDEISDVIQMALSDHITFEHIKQQYGLREKEVQTLMRKNLRRGSYQAWRKRVRKFGSRREFYK